MYGAWSGYNGRVDLYTDMPFPYVAINPPTTLPFTLEEVKQWLKIDPLNISEDFVLTTIIAAASEFCQKYTKLTFFTTEFETYRDYFSYLFQLRKYPVQRVNSIEYLIDNIFIPVDPLSYFLTKAVLDYPFISPSSETQWPTYASNLPCRPQSIKINFTAGFGDTADTIPSGLKVAMLNHIAAMYQNRGDCSDCTANCGTTLPTESRNEYNLWKIISVGPSRN